MKRRDFIIKSSATGLSLGLLSACGGGGSAEAPALPDINPPGNGNGSSGSIDSIRDRMPAYSGPDPFQHGIASGDPLAYQVILWTRITAEGLDEIPVIVAVARDTEFNDIVYEGVGYARSQSDYTVKIDPLLPSPGTTYYYRFETLGHYSAIGRTRTTPAPSESVDHLRLAVMSCSNYPYGYFNAYRKVAFRADLDAVLHLGDYIYEYGPGEYDDAAVAADRPVDPPHEIVTLDDYRRRYACYRQDGDLQECHRQHPFICVWDDHEITNDAWMNGAENHNDGEGDYGERKRAAVRAYFEWMPIRRVAPDNEVRIYRHFEFGQLMSLMMLDTRIIGRDKQVSTSGEARDPDRQLLGAPQQRWLFDQLDHSHSRGARWHLIGQQVMIAPLTLGTLPDSPNWSLGGGAQLNFDQWDGYETSRRALLGRIEAKGLDNTVVLTGDIHSSWAMDLSIDPGNLSVYNPFTGEGSLAVEFVTPAVTSPAAPTKGLSDLAALALVPLNPHLKWVDLFHRGYIVLDITPEHCKADWFHLETVSEPSNQETFARAYATTDGANRVKRLDTPSAPKQNPPLLAPAQQAVTESAV
ncbi:alkaline phosphatase D family protein [Marinobacter zhejiangensis]|uniref:Alkaline phosphatase D n=1 Tax=Marinobacter zhejiangensis TaxID=488535 RepID=A0A1I4MB59_9GAMM|nr:alkaline phosphatase D family protein [Marinobacter zhejiangensis]SFM00275.1 alkaline phosphatase D [Marinobacter zhejiangensis]